MFGPVEPGVGREIIHVLLRIAVWVLVFGIGYLTANKITGRVQHLMENAIAVGVILSLGIYLYRTMHPRFAELSLHEDGTLRDAEVNGLAIYDPKEPTANKWAGTTCNGLQIHVVDPRACRPLSLSLSILATILNHHPGEFSWKAPPYEYACIGHEALTTALNAAGYSISS